MGETLMKIFKYILCQRQETTSLHAYTELKEREELEDR